MRIGLILFTVAAAVVWATLFYVTAHAVSVMGASAAGAVFLGDFGHPWRAQFGADFSIHLLLVAAWLIWRSPNWIIGIVCAVLAINLGALFTLPYLVVTLWQAKGDVVAALSGNRFATRDPLSDGF